MKLLNQGSDREIFESRKKAAQNHINIGTIPQFIDPVKAR
jgi:hypothetical protein